MATDETALRPGETVQTEDIPPGTTPEQEAEAAQKLKQENDQAEKIRTAIADTYTFVRSQELNRTIAGYTFDHYIDEAKRRLKGQGRQIVDAAGNVISENTSIGTRPSLLAYLDALEKRFTDSWNAASELAKTSTP